MHLTGSVYVLLSTFVVGPRLNSEVLEIYKVSYFMSMAMTTYYVASFIVLLGFGIEFIDAMNNKSFVQQLHIT